MKKTLLASTALVGASLLAAPASAGQVGSKDAYSVTLGGQLWFAAAIVDEELNDLGQDRGYKFAVNESEVHVNARATADNGMNYGVSIELNAGAADSDGEPGRTTLADEAWAFISNDSWGRLEMGDQDDVTNRMQIGSWNAHKGLGGPFGGLAMLGTGWHGLGADTLFARADYQNNGATTLDATKINYFTPRFEGFQIGLSYTPDAGAGSGNTGEADNDGNPENIFSMAANYVGKFDDVGLGLSVERMVGGNEDTGAVASPIEDISIWGFGGRLDIAGFTLGAHYRDFGDTALLKGAPELGADAGEAWSVGLGYQSGPWGVSAWYTEAEKDSLNVVGAALTRDTVVIVTDGTSKTKVERLGFGVGYTVAPGWLMRADLEFLDHENASLLGGTLGVDNDGTGFLLTNMFLF